DASCGPPAAGQRVRVIDAWGLSPIEIPGRLYLVTNSQGDGASPAELARTPWMARWRVAEGEGEASQAPQQPGTLEYLGRDDDPLEVDIYRVDPAEMAAILAEHRMVVDAAVVAQTNQAGERRLVAYVVPDRESATVIDPEQQGRSEER